MQKLINFFCRNCLKSYDVLTNYEIIDSTDNPKVHLEPCINLSYDCECGNKAEEIDFMMIDFIIRLNKLGFYTDCCCEGHSNDDKNIDSGTYIMFLSTKEKYSDTFHKLDKHKERFLKRYLKKNEKLMKPLIWKYDSKWNHSISIEVDYESEIAKTILDNYGFNTLKTLCLSRINALITGLEIYYKLKKKIKFERCNKKYV